MTLVLMIVSILFSIVVYEAMHTIRFVCWFSARFWDIHDYLQDCGGDDTPTHFYIYKCWNCGKDFQI